MGWKTLRRAATVSGLVVAAACASAPVAEVEEATSIDESDTSRPGTSGSPSASAPTATTEPIRPSATTDTSTTEPIRPSATTDTSTTDTPTGDTSTGDMPTSDMPTSDTVSTVERPPVLGLGDPLFPELGSPDLDVVSYRVRLDATDPAGELSGSVTIDARVDPALGAVAIDSDGPLVDSVEVDGDVVTFETVDGELVVDTTPEHVADGTVSVTVDYRVTPDPDRISAVGLPVGWLASGDGAYVLNEPDGASTWLPSNDHPLDKATWRFEIETSDD
ncbi:MAG: hypothetical protein AAGG08_15410, partial [Actinomycetota bacterium]